MTIAKLKNGHYAIRYKLDGRWRQVDTRQTDYSSALRFAAEAKIAEIETAARVINVRTAAIMQAVCGRTVGTMEAFDEWEKNLRASRAPKTASRYTRVVRRFLKKRNWPVNVSVIKSVDIDGWVNNQAIVAHRQTRQVNRAALHSYFKFCVGEGWIAVNPVENVSVKYHLLTHAQKESKPRRPFTDEEFARLIAVAKEERFPYWYGVIMIARYAGLRWGDVDAMETDSIQSDKIIVWTDKRDRRVELAMPPELPPVFDMLAKHPLNQTIKTSVPGRLFQQRPVEVIYEEGISDFRRLLAAAGLGRDLVFHCLRHTYATRLAESGLPVKEIAKRMGHFGQQSTLHYLQSLVFTQ